MSHNDRRAGGESEFFLIGIDVVEVRRFSSALEASDRLRSRLFTERELRESTATGDPNVRLAGTFAAKEAVAKALRVALPPIVRDIEIERGPDGAPTATVFGSKRVELSIAHDGGVAVAVALLVGDR